MAPRWLTVIGVAQLLALLASTSDARAATRRRHFEPDDLELEQPGTLDFDLQVGPLYGASASQNHLLLPDFEVGLGLTRSVELDVSGAFSLDRFNRHSLSGEPLWVAVKLGLLDVRDGQGNAWAFGLELGPRLPTIAASGLGYGALALFGFTHHALCLVLNAGSLIDPFAPPEKPRPSWLAGLDLNLLLDTRGVWSLQSELAVARAASPDPDELASTIGATYAVSPKLDLSLTAFAGFLPNTDRAGLLLGLSPQIELW